jgi:hypothetical protein
MNFAIDNYLTNEDTQCAFFNKSLIDLGHNCVLFDSQQSSIYDTFDKNNPDVYVTHGNKISNDLIHYIKSNDVNIDPLINIHKMLPQHIKILSDTFKKNEIKSSFFFTCESISESLKNSIDFNVIQISNCADSNLMSIQNSINYSIEKAIVYFNKSELKSYEGTYHNVGNHKIEGLDFFLPEMKLATLYKNYSTIIFRNISQYVPQGFFDAILSGCKVYYDIDNEDEEKAFESQVNKLFKPEKSLNFNSKDKLTDFSDIHNVVKDKHLDKNRTKTLLSNIRKNK